jgi:uncharacterized delta-60 repeat protein
LDPTFGAGGAVITDVGGTSGSDAANDIAVLPDGATVAVGYTQAAGGGQDFALVKYRPDGSLDPTFGTGGEVVTDVSGTGGDDLAFALAVQPDGKLVVAGAVVGGDQARRFAVARYGATGVLDPTFGTGGIVVTDLAGGLGGAHGVAVQTDGKIVAVGSVTTAGGVLFAAARYRPDGSLDPAFGTGGTVTTGIVTPNPSGQPATSMDFASTVAIQPDGKIVVGGAAGLNYGRSLFGYDFAMVRYTAGGVLDPGFGTGGTVLTDLPNGTSAVQNIALRPDGRIVAVGYAGGRIGEATDVAVVQYRKTGRLDTTFGTGGVVLTDLTGALGSDIGNDVAVRPDGQLLVAGWSMRRDSYASPSDYRFLLARYTGTGGLDPTFGSGGVVLADVNAASSDDHANALAVRPDGRVVVGGYTYTTGTGADFTVACYQQ